MNLTPGLRLGPYEIVAAIGAGGMGEVHRARDHMRVDTVDSVLSPDGSSVITSRKIAALPQPIVVMTNWNAR